MQKDIEEPTSRRKSAWPFILKAGVSLVLLWLTLRHVALSAVQAEIASVDRLALVGSLLILAVATLIAAMRWSVILGALGMPRGPGMTYPVTLIGLFFGQALPAGVGGDVVRAWLGCKTGLTARTAISSILGDRLSGFLAILLIITIQLPKIKMVLPHSLMFDGLVFVLVGSYAAIIVVMALDKLPTAWRRFRVFRGLAGLSDDLRAALFSRAGVLVLLCGAVVQLANVFAVFVLAQGLHLQQAGLLGCLLVVPLANIAQSVPISVAGWGVRESFFVTAFGVVGVAAPEALAVSIVFGLLVIVSSLPGGVLWLLQGAGSPTKLREASF